MLHILNVLVGQRVSVKLLTANVVLIFAFLPISAGAISRRHDVEDRIYLELARDYPEVGRFSFGSEDHSGSGVLIAPRWVLLTSHSLILQAGPFSFEIGGKTYETDWSKRHFAELPRPDSASFDLDIALLHLTEPVTNVVPAVIYGGQKESGTTATIVGFGLAGDGRNGVPHGGEHKKRAARNVIDAAGSFERTPVPDPNGRVLFYDFDGPSDDAGRKDWFNGSSTPLPFEGIMTSGDSGGGVFIETSAGRRLIGLNSGLFGENGAPTKSAGAKHLYGIGSRVVRVSSFRDWIDRTIGDFESNRVPMRGLTAHWGFEEPDGGYAHDLSGVGHRGTILGAKRAEQGVIGRALEFGDSPDSSSLPMTDRKRVEVQNKTQQFYEAGLGVAQDLKISGDITLSAWVNRKKSGAVGETAMIGVEAIISKVALKADASSDMAFVIWKDKLRLYSGDEEFVESGRLSELQAYGRWQHLVVTRSAGDVTFYWNAMLVGSGALDKNFPTTDQPLIIGNHSRAGMGLSGLIDEVRIYNHALSAEEVTALFSSERNPQ